MIAFFRPNTKPNYARDAYPVMDSESLRLMALGKSWQRDRSVAARRLAWRWFLWFVPRFVLPPLLLLGLLWYGWQTWQTPVQPKPDPEHAPLTLQFDTSLHSKEP